MGSREGNQSVSFPCFSPYFSSADCRLQSLPRRQSRGAPDFLSARRLKSTLLIHFKQGKTKINAKISAAAQKANSEKTKIKKTKVGKVLKHHSRTVGRISAFRLRRINTQRRKKWSHSRPISCRSFERSPLPHKPIKRRWQIGSERALRGGGGLTSATSLHYCRPHVHL